MELSYWEYKSWLSKIDFTVVGSGIVGLCTAYFLKQRFPKAKIVVLERGVLPQGASTKNAGFACFGSISEIISDLNHHTEDEVLQLVSQRHQGIQLLRKLLGDDAMDFQINGGHELFLKVQTGLYDLCQQKMPQVNQLLENVFGNRPFVGQDNVFNFSGINPHYITHRFEAQLDTGKMAMALLEKVRAAGVLILNAISVTDFLEDTDHVQLRTSAFEMKTGRLLITTNGFAQQLLTEDVRPARAQVLITQPIKDLHIKGTFHFDEGYYYFRNIDNRILLGGGRNLDFTSEETTHFGQTELIQQHLEALLKQVVLPDNHVQIERRWSGIMGVGQQKRPIIKQVSNRVFCGVRLGGMGVAIGSLVGKELADLL